MTPQMERSLRAALRRAALSTEFISVSEILDDLKKDGALSIALEARVIEVYQKSLLRKMLRELGFHSIVTRDVITGRRVRRYKNEELFRLDDYEQTVIYHVGMAQHHVHVAREMAAHAETRFGVVIQLDLDFVEPKVGV